MAAALGGALLAAVAMAPAGGMSPGPGVAAVPVAPGSGDADDGPSVGRRIPDFRLRDPGGQERSFAELRGRVTLVNFWATWCIPCKAEMPDLEALYREYGDEGLVVVGIALDPKPGPVREFLTDQVSVSYPVLLATDEVQELFGGILGIPTTFLLDGEGVVREQYIGFRYRKTYEKAIRNLLGLEPAKGAGRPRARFRAG